METPIEFDNLDKVEILFIELSEDILEEKQIEEKQIEVIPNLNLEEEKQIEVVSDLVLEEDQLIKEDIPLSKLELITAWVNNAELNGIKQGSDEWKRARRIGGSSVAVFAPEYNPFKNKKDLAFDLLGISKFTGSIQTQWGNLMEDVICNYVMLDKKCNIIGTELFIRDQENIFTYSPDGLGVINIDGQEQVVLFEFKCPYSRMPSGKVPVYYVPQVKMGLCMIEQCDIGLFAEAVIRRCAFADLGFNKRRDMSLVDIPKRPFAMNPLAIGLILFYVDFLDSDGDSLELDKFIDMITFIYGGLDITNDLGVLDPAIFKQMMELFNVKKIKVEYGSTILCDKELNKISSDLKQFSQQTKKVVGTLPWKLFKIDYHYITKDESYLDDIREPARQMIEFTRSIMDIPSQKEQIRLVHNKYGFTPYDEM